MLASLYLPAGLPRDEYPFSVPALHSLSTLAFSDSRITFFTGENGSGKSTLWEAIALNYGLSLEGGNRNFAFDDSGVHPVAYEDTPAFQITRRFLADPASMLHRLLDDSED